MPAYRRVPVDKLTIDPRYQREFKEKHCQKIVADYDEALLQVLEVSEREDGTMAVFDGQHRFRALERLAVDTAPCLVHGGLTPGQEADLFRRLQDRRVPLMPLDRFKARLFAEPPDPVAHGINETCRSLGVKIGPSATKGELAAIVVAERVFKRGNLRQSLSLITRMWHGERAALDGALLDGMSRFLHLYQREFDEEHALTKWEPISPIAMLRKADQFRKKTTSKAYGVLEALRDEYVNKNNRLPSVDLAIQDIRAIEHAGSVRYRRVQVSEVRDAGMELRVFTPEIMHDHLRISMTAARDHILELTKLGQFQRSRVTHASKRELVGTPCDGLEHGKHFYRYVPIHERKRPGDDPRRRPRHDTPSPRSNGGGADAVPYTGKPLGRSGNLTRKQKLQAERGRKIRQ